MFKTFDFQQNGAIYRFEILLFRSKIWNFSEFLQKCEIQVGDKIFSSISWDM